MQPTPLPADPAALEALLDGLDPDTIRDQLAELEARSDALKVLLRAALARERKLARLGGSSKKREATHA
jgi:hypothetical protein